VSGPSNKLVPVPGEVLWKHRHFEVHATTDYCPARLTRRKLSSMGWTACHWTPSE